MAGQGYLLRLKTDGAIRTVVPGPIFRLVSFCMGILDSAQGYLFDRLLGISTREKVITEGSVLTSGVLAGGGDRCPYSGSQWLPVRRALKNIAPGPSDIFVDLGSGKGRVLLIAARLPFRRALGVEIDDELSHYARRNIKCARPRLLAKEVDSITADVLAWPIPDETSVIFMFNPFIGRTFRLAVGQIFESYDRNPRTLHIVYRYPWEHDWLLSTGRVIVTDVRSSLWPTLPRWWQSGDVIVSYRVVGAAEGSRPDSSHRRSERPRRGAQRWTGPNGQRFTM
jgi:SAM-dependent methyltransferase